MKEVSVGQNIYVTRKSVVLDLGTNLEEYEVVKVTGTSFYAKKDGTGRELRFNRRTLECKETLTTYRAYKTEKEYREQVEAAAYQRKKRSKFRRRAYVKLLATSQRFAAEGDQVVIVRPIHTVWYREHRIGEVYEVKDVFSSSIHTTTGLCLWDSEYRVIEDRTKDTEGVKRNT